MISRTNIPPLGVVATAVRGARGFDTDSVISYECARQFARDGYRFCVRYVSRAACEPSTDITRSEAGNILAGGLALMLIQHVRAGRWAPNANLGSQDGAEAAAHASELGCPEGLSLWCDLEGVAETTPSEDVIGYANAWYAAVAAAGFTPGLYVCTCALHSDQLHHALRFQHYWKAGVQVPDVAIRGYQMTQHPPPNIAAHGITIDVDTIDGDREGGLPRWLVPAGST